MSGRIRLEAEERTEPTQAPEPAQPPPHEPKPPPPPPEPEPAAAAPAPSEGRDEASQADTRAEPELPAEVQKRMDRLKWEAHAAKRALEDQQRAWQAEQARQRAAQLPQGTQDPEERAFQRYQQMGAEAAFTARCNEVYRKGSSEYPDFDEAVQRLNQVGYDPSKRPPVLEAIGQMPDGHHIYRQLAQDPDMAARMLALPPMDMAMELARMAARLEAQRQSQATNGAAQASESAAPVTRAPAPLRPVGGNSARSEVPLEKTSMADFIRRRDRDERGSSRIRR